MKVRLHPKILNQPGHFDNLNELRQFFEQERHVWIIDDLEAVEHSAWLADQGHTGTRASELFLKASTDQSYANKTRLHKRQMEVETDSHDAKNFGEAYTILKEPVRVAVENQESDGTFIQAMIRIFDRDELKSALQDGWWELYHLGGAGLAESRFKQLSGPAKLRYLLVVDSDARFPGDTEARSGIEKVCREHGIEAIFLRKRESENYLPLRLLPKMTKDKKPRPHEALKNLTPEQRSHYDMKLGFPEKQTHEETKKLFSNVEEGVLKGGFGKEIWKRFNEPISANEIVELCWEDPEEIPRLLNAIEAIL